MLHRPVFIVGCARSGTTLMRSLLSAHPSIAFTPESHFLAHAAEAGSLSGAPVDFEAFWRDYMSPKRVKSWGIDPERARTLIARTGDTSFRTIFAALLAAFAEAAGKPRVGEKTPRHVDHVPLLLEWFSDARVLFMRRDPRAFVTSILDTPWVRETLTPRSLAGGLVAGKRAQAVADQAWRWRQIYGSRLTACQNDPRVRVVAYEAMVREPEATMQEVCAFLGEPFEPAMLSAEVRTNQPYGRRVMREGMWGDWRAEHHGRSRGPVTTSSLDKWRGRLTRREVAMIEGRCGATMTALGYVCTESRPRRIAGRIFAATVSSSARWERAARAALPHGSPARPSSH